MNWPAKPSLGSAIGGARRHESPGEGLRCPDDASDFCASEVATFEAVDEPGPRRHRLFMLVRSHHHRDGVAGVNPGALFLDPNNRRGGLFEPAGADQVPGGLWGKVDQDHERDGPDPLDGKGDTEGPFVGARRHSLEHASGDELADDPAEVDVGGEVATERNRRDFARVRNARGLERSPAVRREVKVATYQAQAHRCSPIASMTMSWAKKTMKMKQNIPKSPVWMTFLYP